ncbi:WbqC family protein, partial [Patescibacteria group bacterium]|nr:WbqC family protein [Patescibacteria group bacterium]
YDDVQYDKNGWRNRNRIKTQNGITWITIPVHGSINSKISEIKIDNTQNWQRKHINAIRINYCKSPYFDEYWPIFSDIFNKKWEKLIDLQIVLIKKINKILGINRKIKFSSKLNISGNRIDRLINICKYFDANIFYEGATGKNYIDEKKFNDVGIKIKFQDYKHPRYHQLYGDFVSHLSIIDLIFNEGPNSLNILISNIK